MAGSSPRPIKPAFIRRGVLVFMLIGAHAHESAVGVLPLADVLAIVQVIWTTLPGSSLDQERLTPFESCLERRSNM